MERMRRASVLLVAAISVVFGHPLKTADAAEPSQPSLQGAWRAVSIVHDGEQVGPNEAGRLLLVISDKKITMRVGPKVIAETAYTVDATSKPAAIHMVFQGQSTLGIYEQTGTKLRICLNDEGKGRPKKIPAILGQDCEVDLSLSRADRDWIPIQVRDADGGNPRALLDHPDFIQQGSPEWSRDGSKVALDACRPLLGESWSACHILTCQADGKGLKDLGPGAMPSWSPDGKRITFSSYGGGVMIISADGTGREGIDEGGWGAQWCPKENKITYTKYSGGATLCVYDLTAQESRTVVDDGYRQIYYGLDWSPDGRWIAFKGVKPDGKSELVVVSAEGQKKDLRVLAGEGKDGVLGIMANVSWSPDSKQVLAGLATKANPNMQLFLVDIDGKTPPKCLPKQPKDQSFVAVAWSPDGKHIVSKSVPVAAPPKAR